MSPVPCFVPELSGLEKKQSAVQFARGLELDELSHQYASGYGTGAGRARKRWVLSNAGSDTDSGARFLCGRRCAGRAAYGSAQVRRMAETLWRKPERGRANNHAEQYFVHHYWRAASRLSLRANWRCRLLGRSERSEPLRQRARLPRDGWSGEIERRRFFANRHRRSENGSEPT